MSKILLLFVVLITLGQSALCQPCQPYGAYFGDHTNLSLTWRPQVVYQRILKKSKIKSESLEAVNKRFESKFKKKCQIELKLDANGNIAELRILSSSGSQEIDNRIVQLVNGASPFGTACPADPFERYILSFPDLKIECE